MEKFAYLVGDDSRGGFRLTGRWDDVVLRKRTPFEFEIVELEGEWKVVGVRSMSVQDY
ncbi:MAG: hypothetical protein RL112_897 [Planctomycetota bacterium]